MITFLRGNINSLSENSIVIDVSGVGYNCIVSSNTCDFFSSQINKEVVVCDIVYKPKETKFLKHFLAT